MFEENTMKSVNLVATQEVIQQTFPDSRPPRLDCKPGVMSANFSVVPNDCKTAFGRWLAERILTTRRDDDLSRLVVITRNTEEDLHVREMAQRMTNRHIKTIADMERLHKDMSAWIEERKKFAAAYGETLFAARAVDFDWPVLGSNAAGGIRDTGAYFDLCARLIRQMRPARVYVAHSHEEPPASLGVYAT